MSGARHLVLIRGLPASILGGLAAESVASSGGKKMDPNTPVEFTEAAILGRLLEPEKADLPPDVARHILAIQFGSDDRERMNELAEKARSGALTPAEESILENYRHVGRLLALMQSKARLSLTKIAA